MMLSRCQLPPHFSKAVSTSFLAACSSSGASTKNYSTSSSSSHSSESRKREPASRIPRYLQDIDEPSTPLRRSSRQKPIIPFAAQSTPKPRQTMTERESKVLTDMLDLIFASNDEATLSSAPKATKSQTEPQGGVGPVQVDDLFGRLRRLNTRKSTYKARAATAEMFDLKKEQMNSCKSDQELLQWAAREVFEESTRYEKAAKQAVTEAVKAGSKQKNAPPLQSPIYPQMIAHLMRTFREQYHDPNLALYIFDYAQKLSIVSYTFGCSTEAYNELIETRWLCFKDLRGVLDALNEMSVNAVPINSQTYSLVDRIRLEFGQDASLKQTENSKLLTTIEDTLSRMAHGKDTKRIGLNAWKSKVAEDDSDGFDDWTKSSLMNFNPVKVRSRYAR